MKGDQVLMMRNRIVRCCWTLSVFTIALVVGWNILQTPLRANGDAAGSNGPQPVEEDMHEFMEYVFAPSYERLKAGMSAEPSNKAEWKVIKAEALTLAEASNLLWLRKPEQEIEAWTQTASNVRAAGSRLYQAGRKGDYQSARAAYQAMLQQCNRCHQEFADGEYQLEP